MGIYILKSTAILSIFWILYILFIERENMHHFKRFYLLMSVISALCIPLLSITEYAYSSPDKSSLISNAILPIHPNNYEDKATGSFWTLEHILLLIYALGTIVFSMRFINNLITISKTIASNEKQKLTSLTYVLLKQVITPHTFLNYIFLNKSKFKNNGVPETVLLHEQTHAKQKHSLDILFIELIQIVLWFQPLIWLYKKRIKLNHEFLADQAVLQQGHDAKTYQHILLQFSSNTIEDKLSSAINYSSIKKRFTVMKTQTSTMKKWVLSLLPFLLLAVSFYSFSTRKVVTIETSKDSETPLVALDQVTKNLQTVPTVNEVTAYNNWAKSFKQQSVALGTDAEWFPPINEKDLLHFADIYKRMTPKQKQGAISLALIDDVITFSTKKIRPDEPFSKSSNYASAFLEGAKRNNKKAIVIEITDTRVRLNGKPSSLATFKNDMDAITKDWNTSDYQTAVPSFLFKDVNDAFMKALNMAFLKTQYSKSQGDLNLIIPTPPSPPQLTKTPPLSSTRDHLKSMKAIGGVFYYENERISYQKAVQLVKKNKNLHVQTAYPYTTSPTTYISKHPIQGEIEAQTHKPVTKKEIKTYNQLAKKYHKNPNDKILKTEVNLMYDIYNRMTEAQRKSAQPYPAIPPPPPSPSLPIKPSNIKQHSGQNPPVVVTNLKRFKEKYPGKYAQLVASGTEVLQAVEVHETENPPPPPPPNIEKLASQGAHFFYNDEAINAKKAIQLQNNKTAMNIKVQKFNNNDLRVYLKDAITIHEKAIKNLPPPPPKPVAPQYGKHK